MDVNRSVMIIRVSRSGQEIDITTFFNDPEAGDAVFYGKALLTDDELKKLCEDAGRVMSMAAHSENPQARLLAEMQRIGKSVFETVFNPEIRELFKDQSINYLLLAVDEPLLCLPWEILHDGEEFLVLSYAVGIVPGVRQERFEIDNKDLSRTMHALVMAPSSPYLGLTYQEGVAVMNKLYLRRDAIKATLKIMDIDLKFANENIGKSDIIHFLGHASYNTYDPSRSGWSFKGGVFSSENIKSLGTSHTPFFVFSDTTQYGKQEEWPVKNFFIPEGFLIAKAFLLAGTMSYVETFWKVPDEARLLFVKEFYGFAAEGFPVGEALKMSRLKVLEAYGKASLLWASYRFYGNPAVSFFEKERPLSAVSDKTTGLEKEAKSLLKSVGGIKRAIVFMCLFLLFAFAIKSIMGLFNTLEIWRPDFEKGIKYIFSKKKAEAVDVKGTVEELKYLAKVDVGHGGPESAGAGGAPTEPINIAGMEEIDDTGILNDLTLLAEKEYFDLLVKDSLKNISGPNRGEKAHADSLFKKGLAYANPKNFSENKIAHYLNKAEQAYLSMGESSDAARACLVSGYSHLMAESYAKAVKDLARGIETLSGLPDNGLRGLTYKALGDVYFVREKYSFARAFYRKAISLNKRSSARINWRAYNEILHKMSLLTLKIGNINKALDYCGKIDLLKARVRSNISTSSDNNIYLIVSSLSRKKKISASEFYNIYFSMASACFDLGYINDANAFIDRGMQYRPTRTK